VATPLVARANAEPGQCQVSVKCGAFFPGHGAMRDQAAHEWWYVGLDLDPGFQCKPANGTVRFGADFDFRDAEGRGVFTIPLTAKVTWGISPKTEALRLYGGLGPGVYFINSRHSGAVVKPGLQFVAGLDLGDSAFVEVAYDWVGAFYDSEGTPLRADGVKAAFGVRF
jgi:hypothetical protein